MADKSTDHRGLLPADARASLDEVMGLVEDACDRAEVCLRLTRNTAFTMRDRNVMAATLLVSAANALCGADQADDLLGSAVVMKVRQRIHALPELPPTPGHPFWNKMKGLL